MTGVLENVALFDMDGSLADYEGSLRADLAQLAVVGDPDLTDMWKVERQYPAIARRMDMIKAQPGWWLALKPIPEGMRVFRAARKIGFTNVVLTKGPRKHPLAWAEKVQWCRQYLGKNTPVIVTDNKSIVYGKFLYDDFPTYARSWLKHRPRGLVIMPANANNRRFKHDQVLKWDGTNWDEIYATLEALFKRKAGEELVL